MENHTHCVCKCVESHQLVQRSQDIIKKLYMCCLLVSFIADTALLRVVINRRASCNNLDFGIKPRGNKDSKIATKGGDFSTI